MTRLIDADAIKYRRQVFYKKDDSDEIWVEWIATASEIEKEPTIDAVQVVRCKDCKWRNTIGCDSYVASRDERCCEDDDFCKWGERKDDE